jgi:uncharacterized membrane protein required for colicin V production
MAKHRLIIVMRYLGFAYGCKLCIPIIRFLLLTSTRQHQCQKVYVLIDYLN